MAETSTDRSSVRRQQLMSDIGVIVEVCTADKENPFCRKRQFCGL